MNQRPISLTLRLTLLFGAVSAVVLLTFGWIIERSLEHHFSSEDISELKIIARSLEQSLATLHSAAELERTKQRLDDLAVGHHGALLHISDMAGNVIYASAGPDFSTVPLASAGQWSPSLVQQWSDGNHNYRLLIQRMAAPAGPYNVIIAVAIDFHLHFLNNFHRTLWFMTIGGIVAMGLMGWIVVRQGHRPLRHIISQIRQISANQLSTRLTPEGVPAELAELAQSFNELLQRLEESFTRLANFSADIAHELRTPVTNLMTQTQVSLAQTRDVTQYQEILYSNVEEYERMAQMIGDMLFLAKADNGLNPPTTVTVDLATEVINLFDYYEAWAEEQGVSLSLKGGATVECDRLMLRRALSNLLANAIRHTPAGSGVTVQLGRRNNEVVISVQNPGSPIPAEHLPHLFDRFYRIDPSRQRSSEEAGLGLAIVKSIIDIHGGKIVVNSDKNSTEFQITLSARA